ncbi:hypothetical protein DFJ58DRAFT_770588 [Suillus subalutaceus]|uniref:uncharacterized protein n=1 Tax=Suillus subalutaceus TaxID=48586 RepID=UPI001B872154|nr:uncharacterized protein DFJ58DRAFT_770588 [Suillus subalutaceus]KAG1865871.1 hypothetical protein DFJ58DRAFT_770588 [Suillus subalutaceus]
MTTVKLDSHILEKDAGIITEQLNIQSQQATVRTLQILFLRSKAQLGPIHYNPPIFLLQSSSIAPSYTDAAPQDVTDYLEKLVRAAQQTAESHYCGSFVAGQTSESDEFADIGIWLGEGNYQRNHEKEILDKLGLIAWADAEIYQMDGLYDEKVKVELEGAEESVIGKLLDSLEDCHRFFARRQDSYLAYFLIGRLKAGWCGLASIGVTS